MRICLVYTSLIALLVLGFVGHGVAGQLTIGAKASIYDPPGEAGPTPMLGAYVSYSITQYLSAEGAVEWTQYDNTTLIPMTVNMMYHPLGKKVFDPYIGGGGGYYYEKTGDDIESTIGCQSLIGLKWNPTQDFGVSFEAKYIIPDVKKPSKGGFSYGGAITGTMTTRL
ncbi:MAG: outer membrane beta-barrel protein [bacterium]|nr:outer membrane beta-barrel protein [bacterium]